MSILKIQLDTAVMLLFVCVLAYALGYQSAKANMECAVKMRTGGVTHMVYGVTSN